MNLDILEEDLFYLRVCLGIVINQSELGRIEDCEDCKKGKANFFPSYTCMAHQMPIPYNPDFINSAKLVRDKLKEEVKKQLRNDSQETKTSMSVTPRQEETQVDFALKKDKPLDTSTSQQHLNTNALAKEWGKRNNCVETREQDVPVIGGSADCITQVSGDHI